MNRTFERSNGFRRTQTVRPVDFYSYLLNLCEDCVLFVEKPAVNRSLRIVSGIAAIVTGFLFAGALINNMFSPFGIFLLGSAFVCLGVFSIRGKSGF